MSELCHRCGILLRGQVFNIGVGLICPDCYDDAMEQARGNDPNHAEIDRLRKENEQLRQQLAGEKRASAECERQLCACWTARDEQRRQLTEATKDCKQLGADLWATEQRCARLKQTNEVLQRRIAEATEAFKQADKDLQKMDRQRVAAEAEKNRLCNYFDEWKSELAKRQQAEAKLQEAEQGLRDLADSSGVGDLIQERDDAYQELHDVQAKLQEAEAHGIMQNLNSAWVDNDILKAKLQEAEAMISRMHKAAIPDGEPIRGTVEDIQDLRNDLCTWVGIAGKEITARIQAEEACAQMREVLDRSRDRIYRSNLEDPDVLGAWREDIDQALAQPVGKAYAERMRRLERTLQGLLVMMGRIWPEQVFTGVSGDAGPNMVVAMRKAIRKALRKEATDGTQSANS